MPHKNMFNPPFSVIFPNTFYRSNTNGNHLLAIVFPYWNPCIHLECRLINCIGCY